MIFSILYISLKVFIRTKFFFIVCFLQFLYSFFYVITDDWKKQMLTIDHEYNFVVFYYSVFVFSSMIVLLTVNQLIEFDFNNHFDKLLPTMPIKSITYLLSKYLLGLIIVILFYLVSLFGFFFGGFIIDNYIVSIYTFQFYSPYYYLLPFSYFVLSNVFILFTVCFISGLCNLKYGTVFTYIVYLLMILVGLKILPLKDDFYMKILDITAVTYIDNYKNLGLNASKHHSLISGNMSIFSNRVLYVTLASILFILKISNMKRFNYLK